MEKLIKYLIMKRLGLAKEQRFRFNNQKGSQYYYFDKDYKVRKLLPNGRIHESHVSFNYLMNISGKKITKYQWKIGGEENA